MTDYEESTSSKTYPKWDGTKTSWSKFRVKMEGAIAGQSKYAAYSKVLTSNVIKILGTDEANTGNTEALQKINDKLREQDIEMYRVLLTCIPDNDQGTKAYQLILGAKTDHYKHGSFKLAWEKLIKINERKARTVLDTLLTQYLTLKMKEDEDPFDFIMKMSELRRLMRENHKHTIDEDSYLKDILKKLPQNYRTKRSEIEKDIADKKIKEETDLILELGDEYNDLFPDKAETGVTLQEGNSGTESALVGQFKGKCDNCGKWGHKRADCPDRKTSNNNKDGNRNWKKKKNWKDKKSDRSDKETRRCHYWLQEEGSLEERLHQMEE